MKRSNPDVAQIGFTPLAISPGSLPALPPRAVVISVISPRVLRSLFPFSLSRASLRGRLARAYLHTLSSTSSSGEQTSRGLRCVAGTSASLSARKVTVERVVSEVARCRDPFGRSFNYFSLSPPPSVSFSTCYPNSARSSSLWKRSSTTALTILLFPHRPPRFYVLP